MEIGTRVICIDNIKKNHIDTWITTPEVNGLTLNKIYTVTQVHKFQGKTNFYITGISVINDNMKSSDYEVFRFKSIEDDREEKLNKILSKN